MRRYLSFGGGVNSVALGLWLMDHGIEAERVYADHGADWPETREYVQHLKERGLPITILDTGDIYA
jgi:3'-phosphoadenosine 5'-phosphosulfate sulfotransferase (PAPS reductase)/FAD synthetase